MFFDVPHIHVRMAGYYRCGLDSEVLLCPGFLCTGVLWCDTAVYGLGVLKVLLLPQLSLCLHLEAAHRYIQQGDLALFK